MERLDGVELGTPGPLVHTLETLRGGYEMLLAESVRRKPTLLSVWMVNRILNVNPPDAESWLCCSEASPTILQRRMTKLGGKRRGSSSIRSVANKAMHFTGRHYGFSRHHVPFSRPAGGKEIAVCDCFFTMSNSEPMFFKCSRQGCRQTLGLQATTFVAVAKAQDRS